MTIVLDYPARLETDEEGWVTVFFRDVAEALTDGADREEALAAAEDALLTALTGYVDEARSPKPLPRPSKPRKGEVTVALPLIAAAKFALHDAMREAGITGAELARRMDLPVTTIRRLLDIRHKSKIEQLVLALGELGKRAELRVRDLV